MTVAVKAGTAKPSYREQSEKIRGQLAEMDMTRPRSTGSVCHHPALTA
jgi:hypothetical protein